MDLMVVTRRPLSVSAERCSIAGSLSRKRKSRISRPRYMFWTTSRLSQSARSWYTTSIPSRAESFGPWMWTSSPSKCTVPPSNGWMPAIDLISVDLPAPLSPTSAITSPSRTSKSTSISACTEPKVFDRPRISRSGVSLMGRLRTTVEAPGGASTLIVDLLAVLLVLPGAHVAALQELVREETRVVGLRDRDHGDHEC